MTSLRRAQKMAEAKLGKNHYDTSLVYVNVAEFYEMRQQWKDLSELYSFMIPLFIKAGTPMERMVRMQYKYGNALLRSGQNAKAAKAFATGAQWARKVTMWRMDDWEGLHYAGQAVALTNLKKYGEASEAVKAGAKVCDLDDPNNYMRPESELLMARGYLSMAQGKDGLKDYKEAYDAFGKYFDSQLYVKYATALAYAKKYEGALAIMREWYDRSKKHSFLHIAQKARPWSLVEPLSMYLLKKTGKRRPEVTRLAKELCKTWLVQKRTTTQPSEASEARKRK